MSTTLEAPPVQDLTTVAAREILNGERRWLFACTYVEPVIKEASNDDTAETLLPNHEFLIRNPAPALVGVKCRKTAWSWGIALKTFARAVTEEKSTSIIGSYDEDEAREKLNFLDWIYRAVCDRNPALLREWGMTDGMEVRRFNNHSRIRFISRKAPTGAGASIEWDEFSVESPGRVTAAEILAAALGCTTHTGTVSLGGTQRGPDTVFNQIVSGEIARKIEEDPKFQNMPRRSWVVGKFPWWRSPALVQFPPHFKDLDFDTRKAAQTFYLNQIQQECENLPTEVRVERFGNDKLKQQFVLYCTTPELGFEIFQREFEMLVLDDKESYFEDDLVQYCYEIAGQNYTFYHAEAEGTKYGQFGDCLEKAKRAVDRLASEIRSGKLRGAWGFSMDVGDDRDPDEIWVGQVPNGDREMLLPRLNIQLRRMGFDGKEEMIHYIMAKLPIVRGKMDATKGSLSTQLSQRMSRRYGLRCEPFPFTLDSKTILATGMKSRMQAGKLPLPPRTKEYSKLHIQIKRVKREESGKQVRFDAARNKDDHADAFWSLALLCEVFATPFTRRPRIAVVTKQNPVRISNPFIRGRAAR